MKAHQTVITNLEIAEAIELIPYGVTYLDDALRGIGAGELIICAAYTGSGKTDLLATIAQQAGKNRKVTFYALEAHHGEIEERLMYRLVSREFYAKSPRQRPSLGPFTKLNYPDFHRGRFNRPLAEIILSVSEELNEITKNIDFVYAENLDANTLAQDIESRFDEYDLFLVDHLHHLEFGTDELEGIKEVMKLTERVINSARQSIVFASHFRKQDRNFKGFPSLHELHGSSEISKRATAVILLGPTEQFGSVMQPNQVGTAFQIAKWRLDSSVRNYYGILPFNVDNRTYAQEYFLCKRADGVFEQVTEKPFWAKNGLTNQEVNNSYVDDK